MTLRLLSRLPGILLPRPVTRVSSARHTSRGDTRDRAERNRTGTRVERNRNMETSRVERNRNMETSRVERYRNMGGFHEEEDIPDVEDAIDRVYEEEMLRKRHTKYQMLHREMTPSGPPERKLTWQSIEQIRFLRREEPEEWTVERLATGFSVSTGEIRRILRSNFLPPPERRVRQDAGVMKVYGRSLPPGVSSTPRLPETPAAVLTSGHTSTGLVPGSDRHLMVLGQSSAPALVQESHSLSSTNTKPVSLPGGDAEEAPAEGATASEEEWDGLVLSDPELEELMDLDEPPPHMCQEGNEFYDAQGNFLFRL